MFQDKKKETKDTEANNKSDKNNNNNNGKKENNRDKSEVYNRNDFETTDEAVKLFENDELLDKPGNKFSIVFSVIQMKSFCTLVSVNMDIKDRVKRGRLG